MSITQTATKKIAITERALYQRISRRLRRDGQQLRTNRSERWFRDLGLYYTVDLYRNAIEASHLDLETLGRELGVIRPWEEIADGSTLNGTN